jgi:hypothetical protein
MHTIFWFEEVRGGNHLADADVRWGIIKNVVAAVIKTIS